MRYRVLAVPIKSSEVNSKERKKKKSRPNGKMTERKGERAIWNSTRMFKLPLNG